MGPRLVGRGGDNYIYIVTITADASMGPRLVGRGGEGLERGLHVLVDASMGPRLVGRGGEPDDIATTDGEQLQWGRGWLAAEALTINDVRELEDLLQWGRGWLAAEARST